MPRPTAEIVAFVLINICVIVALARLLGSSMRFIRQPVVVGEILAGIALGPSLLGWISDDAVADFFIPEARPVLSGIATLAICFFMYLVGQDLDLGLLRGRIRQATVVTVAAVAVPFAAGFAVAPLLRDEKYFLDPANVPDAGKFALFIGAALTITAFPVMARILIERRLTRSPMGAIGLASAAAVTILMFLLVAVAAGAGEAGATSSNLQKIGWTVLFLVVMAFPVRYALGWVGRYYDRVGALTPNVIAGIFVLITLTGYITDRIGLTAVIGPFVLGLVMPRREGMALDLRLKIDTFAVLFLLPVFFGFSGLSTNLRTLSADLVVGAVVFVAVGIAAKWLATAVAGRAVGLTWREGNLLGVLMSCRGLLPLLVAQVGVTAGVIEAGGPMYAIFVVYAVVTTLMTNPAASLFLPKEPAPSPAPEAAGAVAAAGPAYRVLVAVTPTDSAARLAGAARAAAGTNRPLELIVVQPAERPESPYRLSADGGGEVGATLSGLVPLAAIVGGPDVTVTPLSFMTADLTEDVLGLVDELRPDLVVVGVGRRGGAAAVGRARRIASASPCPVVVFHDPTGEGAAPDGDRPVVADPRVGPLAAQIAAGIGSPLTADAPAGAVAIVIGMEDGWEATLPAARCPVFVVAQPVPAAVPVAGG